MNTSSVKHWDDLKFGCTAGGATHQDTNIPDIKTKAQMVKDAGVFDYIDRTPTDDEFADLLKASERLDLPVLAGGWFYTHWGATRRCLSRTSTRGDSWAVGCTTSRS